MPVPRHRPSLPAPSCWPQLPLLFHCKCRTVESAGNKSHKKLKLNLFPLIWVIFVNMFLSSFVYPNHRCVRPLDPASGVRTEMQFERITAPSSSLCLPPSVSHHFPHMFPSFCVLTGSGFNASAWWSLRRLGLRLLLRLLCEGLLQGVRLTHSGNGAMIQLNIKQSSLLITINHKY